MDIETPASEAPSVEETVQVQAETQQPTPPPPNPLLDAYNACLAIVHASPSDFTAWTNTITAVEKLDDIDKIKSVYDSFLVSWPLCYGYWKKYADAHHRHGNVQLASEVYERAVLATPYSVDIWVHYINYLKALPDASPDVLRSIFERADAAVGTDYLAHPVWDKYLAFEEEQAALAGNRAQLIALYSRILTIPQRDLDKYYQGLKIAVAATPITEVMTEEESSKIRLQIEEENKQSVAIAAAAKAEAAAAAAAESATTSADGALDPEAASAAPPVSAPMDAEAVETPEVTEEDIKAGWLKTRLQLYTSTATELEGRKLYEDNIKRTYFHVKPLDASQLTNWLKYLDFIEKKGNIQATMIVYERCLVPCASYPEFWERYVRWLDAQDLAAEASGALQRAVITFCRSRPEIHMFAMQHDERRGDIEGARARYKLVLGELSPRLLSATVAAANFEKRQGDREAACQLFESLLKEEKAKADEASKSTVPYIAIHYANFLRLVYKDVAKGRAVLRHALDSSPNIKQLWEAAIFYEETTGPDDYVKAILDLCERASAPPSAPPPPVEGEAVKPVALHLPEKDREEFSLRAIELADLYGSVEQVAAAQRRHAAHFLLPASVSTESRKRHAEAAAADVTSRSAKVPRHEYPAAASAHAGYYGHHAAAAVNPAAAAAYQQGYGQYAGYGQYPAAAYGQQAYPGYGGYGY